MSILVNSTLAPRGVGYPLMNVAALKGGSISAGSLSALQALSGSFISTGMVGQVGATRYVYNGTSWAVDNDPIPNNTIYLNSNSPSYALNMGGAKGCNGLVNKGVTGDNPGIVACGPYGASLGHTGHFFLQQGCHFASAYGKQTALPTNLAIYNNGGNAGSIYWAPTTGTIDQNTLTFDGFHFVLSSISSGYGILGIFGTAPTKVFVRNCYFEMPLIGVSGSACKAFSFYNSSDQSIAIFEDCVFDHSTTTATPYPVSCSCRNKTEFYRCTFINGGGTCVSCLLSSIKMVDCSITSLAEFRSPILIAESSATFIGCDICAPNVGAGFYGCIFEDNGGGATPSTVNLFNCLLETSPACSYAISGQVGRMTGSSVNWAKVQHRTSVRGINPALTVAHLPETFT